MLEGASVGSRIPHVEHCIDRTRLLELLSRSVDPATFVVAPGGSGKTVLAAQAAGLDRFDACVWVDCGRVDLEAGELLARTLEALEGVDSDADRPWMLGTSGPEQLAKRVRSVLDEYVTQRLLLVVDDVRLGEATDDLVEMIEAVRTVAAPGSVLLLTARELPARTLTTVGAPWVIDAADLGVRDQEAQRFVAGLVGPSVSQEEQEWLLDASGGHIATLLVLARHAALDSAPKGQAAQVDLQAHLERLALEHLESPDYGALYVMGLLRKGVVSDVEEVVGRRVDARRLADVIPLLAVDGDETFRVHDLAVAAYTSGHWVRECEANTEELRDGACRILMARGDLSGVFHIVQEYGSRTELIDWLEAEGLMLARSGHISQAQRLLRRAGADQAASRPPLRLMQAVIALEAGEFDRGFAIASELAAGDHGELEIVRDASLILGRLELDRANLLSTRRHLKVVLDLPDEAVSPDDRGIAHALMTVCCAYLGEASEARACIDRAIACAASTASVWTRAYVRNTCGGFWAVNDGNITKAERELAALSRDAAAPAIMRIRGSLNWALALTWMGRLDDASVVLDRAEAEGRGLGLELEVGTAKTTRAEIAAARGDYEQAAELFQECIESGSLAPLYFAADWVYVSRWRCASGDIGGALAAADEACRVANETESIWLQALARTGRARAYLFTGEREGALEELHGVESWSAEAGVGYLEFVANLVLAQEEALRGAIDEAAARLRRFRTQITSGEWNLILAQSIKMDESLLPALIEAVGVAGVPSLVFELAGIEVPSDEHTGQSSAGESSPCRRRAEFRLFGGFSASVDGVPIDDRAWRTRKARFLVAMLALEDGRELARDVILDRLWPDMTQEQALNNFYVTWSSARKALEPDLGRGEESRFLRSSGGRCWIEALTCRTDVATFARLEQQGSAAVTEGDIAEVERCFDELATLYTGDLLAADLYEEWTATPREVFRRRFCDAMAAASRFHLEEGRAQQAGSAATHGLEVDLAREDLYRCLIRAHLDQGQHADATRTLEQCRGHMERELGLEPSRETTELLA